jgi:hypothetical protein
MMIVPFPARIGGGGAITFQGPPNTAVYWSLAGLDAQGNEVGAYGALKWPHTRTDARGFSLNFWTGPINPALAGLRDRVKVRYGTG